jgi:hypothetical protein
MLNRIDTKSAVRTCMFSFAGNHVAYSTDKQMGQLCIITVVDTRDFNAGLASASFYWGRRRPMEWRG